MKKSLHNFLYKNPVFLKFIYGLIIINVISIILESYKELSANYNHIFLIIEYVSVFVFTIEYLLRIYTAEYEYDTGTPMVKRFKFMGSTFGLVDLLSILPFYLPLMFVFDLRVLRILRLVRLVRIFKLARYSKSLRTIGLVLKESKEDLAMTTFVAFILLVLSSTLMFYIENEAQPEKFQNIGHAMWWSVATLTTVGYGDVYPLTGLGKVLSGIIALIGIGFVALPTGIISSALISKINETKENRRCTCPSCGNKFVPEHFYKFTGNMIDEDPEKS